MPQSLCNAMMCNLGYTCFPTSANARWRASKSKATSDRLLAKAGLLTQAAGPQATESLHRHAGTQQQTSLHQQMLLSECCGCSCACQVQGKRTNARWGFASRSSIARACHKGICSKASFNQQKSHPASHMGPVQNLIEKLVMAEMDPASIFTHQQVS